MSDCIFCKIIAKELPADILYEDEMVLACMDIMPVQKGHVLVIPKHHAENILHTQRDIAQTLIHAVQELTPKIIAATGADGANITTNIGTAAGQSIFHTHVHIIPRTNQDGALKYTHVAYRDDAERQDLAERIRIAS